ncbi:hypothetical protein [Frigoriglobus tundricola]|uniref:3-keto-disaccharide hydrolase domain-containing protein n=1 Tax=Frigoriglobus tundricola TaxID=2774151 RepID=A0A6M5YJQ8_9BACT|nr:hypothetical protein [Frigoriglobus tundricola]QJW93506.1 hypothetical protein FTUN_1013 [Frigoriglobus tundricola]
MIRSVVAMVLFSGPVCVALADDADPVKEKLFAAKQAYDAEMKVFLKQAEEWFDKRDEAARKDGNKKMVEQIKEERAGFDVSGDLPKAAPAALKQKSLLAKKALEAAYAQAVKDYVRAKKDAEAAAVEQEWKVVALGNAVDLLALVDTKAHTVAGEWTKDQKGLLGHSGRIQLAYEPGDEYDVELTLRRSAGADGFAVGLVAGGQQVLAVVDSWPARGYATGVELVDKKQLIENTTMVKGQRLKGDKSHTLVCSVRAAKIAVTVDGKVASEFKGEFARLSLFEGVAVPNKNALFFHLGPNTSFQIDRAVVKPVKGKGTVLK